MKGLVGIKFKQTRYIVHSKNKILELECRNLESDDPVEKRSMLQMVRKKQSAYYIFIF